MSERLHRAVYLTGPTASGKTAVGVRLARRLGAEVIALDSMTLYRGMDIGTAKPTMEERGGVPHHLIDVLDPWESASVAEYRRMADAAAAEVEARGRRVLFVGGTALYLKAMLRGLFEGPGADPAVRSRLEEEAGRIGSPALHARLAGSDPATAARLHPNDARRIVRALEVLELTGRPLSELQSGHDRPAPPGTMVFALDRPRAELHARINARVDAMFAAGLVDEVRGLLSAPRPIGGVPAQGVGYLEVIDHLQGRATLPSAVERVKARTRQFAKRQMTWFRGLSEVRLRPVDPSMTAEQVADELAGAVEEGASDGPGRR
ncbi:IPP transferase [Aquisphaera giovannonii]|uniref:tRNA dimethylallyltransferase n=1 Tax=Aquisphaera giovannonii TaxID=406548 RepID=A0A5B9W4W4_9BACT|nr:tRNA (adenosine(37)-N6)-dimethylallyltransferase MiaA [Aquisphaera giovannonii]QEH35568.1 IPP transferase [Aquisphaera giovannonii]